MGQSSKKNKSSFTPAKIINIFVWKKEESPITKMRKWIIDGIIIITFVCVTVPIVINNIRNRIDSSKIYLRIYETGWSIPLDVDGIVISIPQDIEENKPIALRFGLTQDNYNPPIIRQIFITFPSDADVKPIPDKGWSWELNNDIEKTYFLNFPEEAGGMKGVLDTLPPFEVKFKNVKALNFKYSIVAVKIEQPIRRVFTIDQTQKQQYKELISTESVDIYNTATPPTVKFRNWNE